MHNIWRIIKSDFKHMFANTMSTIIAIGLVIMPSMFAWYNIMACWNVFDNTGNLTVAVANTDEGYKSDLVPLRVNIGDQVISALRANDQINWTFTTEDDAIDGARSGRYYAAVVIPESFSKDMLTFYSDDVEHGKIVYYSNEKKSAIAPKITDQGADSVSYQINETFTETISEIALSLAESISNSLDKSDVQTGVADMSGHMRTLGKRTNEVATVLGLYAQLATTAQNFVSGSASLITSAQNSMNSLEGIASDGASTASSLTTTLKQSASDLSNAIGVSDTEFANMEDSIDAVFESAQTGASTSSSAMREQAQTATTLAQRYTNAATDLENAKASAPESIVPALDATIAQLKSMADLATSTSDSLNSAADKLDAGIADVQVERDQSKQQIASAREKIADLKADYDTNLKPQLERIASNAASLASSLEGGLDRLSASSSELANSADSASNLLGTATEKINGVTEKLNALSSELISLADSIDAALAAGDNEMLRSILSADTSSFAHALAAPVGIERTAVFPVDSFGSGMAPLYTTLALFIGALLIMVALKPSLSERKQERAGVVNVKPRQLFFGRFGIVAFISLCQTTVMGLGNMLFLQVQVVHPWLFMLCFWGAGLVFVFIIYALVVSFANLGKAVAVLLLIIQVTGCGGSFPLQILPDFVQKLSPWLPATHVVDAMRAAMFGIYNNDFWISMGILLLFTIPAALLGLVLRKPLAGFMKWYVENVESTKVIG